MSIAGYLGLKRKAQIRKMQDKLRAARISVLQDKYGFTYEEAQRAADRIEQVLQEASRRGKAT